MTLYGFQFPITKNPLGFFYSQQGSNNIKGDLLQLIMTNPGERVMLPQFGTPLRKYIFEQNVDSVRDAIKNDIASAIGTWEPRITVTNIQVSVLSQKDPETFQTYNDERGVLVKINYIDPEKIDSVQELVLAVPFGGG